MPLSPAQKSLIHAQAGREAEAKGKGFEAVFQWACRNAGAEVTRIPDGCKVVGGRMRGGNNLIRVKSPFDWIVTHRMGATPVTILCDTKTTAEGTFPYSKINRAQVEELHKHEANGILAGYVIEFRAVNQVFWYPALSLMSFKGRGSIKPGGIFLGSSQLFDVRKIFTPSQCAATPPGRN